MCDMRDVTAQILAGSQQYEIFIYIFYVLRGPESMVYEINNPLDPQHALRSQVGVPILCQDD